MLAANISIAVRHIDHPSSSIFPTLPSQRARHFYSDQPKRNFSTSDFSILSSSLTLDRDFSCRSVKLWNLNFVFVFVSGVYSFHLFQNLFLTLTHLIAKDWNPYTFSVHVFIVIIYFLNHYFLLLTWYFHTKHFYLLSSWILEWKKVILNVLHWYHKTESTKKRASTLFTNCCIENEHLPN